MFLINFALWPRRNGPAEIRKLRWESNSTTVLLSHISFPSSPGEYRVHTLDDTERVSVVPGLYKGASAEQCEFVELE
jgi:hypothetical protein